MSYTPHRDYRWEYISDMLNWMEENQCFNCIFRETGEVIMCMEFQGQAFLEEPMEEWDDLGDEGVACNKRVKSFT